MLDLANDIRSLSDFKGHQRSRHFAVGRRAAAAESS